MIKRKTYSFAMQDHHATQSSQDNSSTSLDFGGTDYGLDIKDILLEVHLYLTDLELFSSTNSCIIRSTIKLPKFCSRIYVMLRRVATRI